MGKYTHNITGQGVYQSGKSHGKVIFLWFMEFCFWSWKIKYFGKNHEKVIEFWYALVLSLYFCGMISNLISAFHIGKLISMYIYWISQGKKTEGNFTACKTSKLKFILLWRKSAIFLFISHTIGFGIATEIFILVMEKSWNFVNIKLRRPCWIKLEFIGGYKPDNTRPCGGNGGCWGRRQRTDVCNGVVFLG